MVGPAGISKLEAIFLVCQYKLLSLNFSTHISESVLSGLLLIIGPEATSLSKPVADQFSRIKNMPVGSQENGYWFSCTQFKGSHFSDLRYIRSAEYCFWWEGFFVYRGLSGLRAAHLFIEDLKAENPDKLTAGCDGHFLCVVRSLTKDRIWVITDHVGMLNGYRYSHGDTVVISTSSLVLSQTFAVTPDIEGIAQFLRTGSVFGSKTIYEEISTLDAATTYYFVPTAGGFKEQATEYWRSPSAVIDDISFNDAKDILSKSLLETFKVFNRDSKTVCDLTAGFDSRLVASTLLPDDENGDRELMFFVFGPEESREVLLVKGYCKELNLKCYHLPLPDSWPDMFPEVVRKALALTDGEENVCNYAPILFAQEFKAGLTNISINGLGGELYRDFWWIQEVLPTRRPANLDRLLDSRVFQYEYDYSIFSKPWSLRVLDTKMLLKREFERTVAFLNNTEAFNSLQIDSIYLKQKMRRWAGRTISSSSQLLDSVAPLVFRKPLEAAMRMPPSFKRNGKLVRAVVEHHNRRFAHQRMLNGTPCEVPSIRNLIKYLPLVVDLSKRGIRKFFQLTLQKSLFRDGSLSYLQGAWFRALKEGKHQAVSSTQIFEATKDLYAENKLTSFLAGVGLDDFRFYPQFGNMLTLELRMRKDSLRKGL